MAYVLATPSAGDAEQLHEEVKLRVVSEVGV